MTVPKPTAAQLELLRRAAIGPVPWWQRPSKATVRACIAAGWLSGGEVSRQDVKITEAGNAELAIADGLAAGGHP